MAGLPSALQNPLLDREKRNEERGKDKKRERGGNDARSRGN